MVKSDELSIKFWVSNLRFPALSTKNATPLGPGCTTAWLMTTPVSLDTGPMIVDKAYTTSLPHVLLTFENEWFTKSQHIKRASKNSTKYMYIYSCWCWNLDNHGKFFRQYIMYCVARNRMMTSSNGNIFRVTGHLCGGFTGPRWIPHTKASDAELWCFLWSASE